MARFGSDLEREIQGIRPPSFDMGDLQDRRRRRARRRRVEGGIVALAVAAAGTLVVLRAVPSDVNPAVPVRPHVVAAYPAGDRPSGVAFADGSVWVGHRTLAEVWRIDPATGRVQARIPTAAGAPTLLAADGSTVWAVSPSGRGSTLLRIDPAGATVVASHPVKVIVDAIAAADGRVWLASRTGDAVLVLDAEGRRLARVDVAGGPSAVALDANGAWVVSGLTGDVTRIAVPGFRARPAGHVDGRPTGAAVCGRALWVSTGDGALARLNPRTGGVRSTEQGRFLTAVAADGAVVWAVDGSGGGATAVDCATGKTLGTVRGGKEPTAVTAAAGHAYIADTGGGLVTEVAT